MVITFVSSKDRIDRQQYFNLKILLLLDAHKMSLKNAITKNTD